MSGTTLFAHDMLCHLSVMAANSRKKELAGMASSWSRRRASALPHRKRNTHEGTQSSIRDVRTWISTTVHRITELNSPKHVSFMRGVILCGARYGKEAGLSKLFGDTLRVRSSSPRLTDNTINLINKSNSSSRRRPPQQDQLLARQLYYHRRGDECASSKASGSFRFLTTRVTCSRRSLRRSSEYVRRIMHHVKRSNTHHVAGLGPMIHMWTPLK